MVQIDSVGKKPKKKPVICLMGPTAVGKSDTALYLAEHLPCEIISVDSVMVYQGMDIGTAKPSLAEQMKVPHHLLSIRDPISPYSAAEFAAVVPELIDAIHRRGCIPLLVGGTGLYFQAWEQGLAVMPSADLKVRESLSHEAAKQGWEALHARLAGVDPDAARRIHPSDTQRIQRALEVYHLTGKPYSTHWKEHIVPQHAYEIDHILILPEDREILRARIRERFYLMLEQGFLEEVNLLWSRGDLSESLPSIRSVGYRQVWQYFSDRCTYQDMVQKAVIATRQYAKRQITWFKRIQNPVTWFHKTRQEESLAWLRSHIQRFNVFIKETKPKFR